MSALIPAPAAALATLPESARTLRFGSREDPRVFRALAGVPAHAPLDCRRGWQLEFDLGVHRVTEPWCADGSEASTAGAPRCL